MDTINTRQNNLLNINLLAAQRQLYKDAKKILVIQIALTIPCAIFFAILIAFYPKIQIWAVVFSLTVSMLDILLLDYLQNTFKTKAATIQEMFDTDVLKLKWNFFKISKKVDLEDIHRLADRYKQSDKGFESLKNWYPVDADLLPINYGRLVCQRCNLRWNSELRENYSVGIGCLVILTMITILVIGLIGNLTLEKFILSFVTLTAPSILWGIKELQKQFESIRGLNILKEHITSSWNELLNKNLTMEELEVLSRTLQDEIFNHRKKDPLIFEWIYKYFKPSQEDRMNRSTSDLVTELMNH